MLLAPCPCPCPENVFRVLKYVLQLSDVTMEKMPYFPTIAIITAASGCSSNHLGACLLSVQAQAYRGQIDHWLVVNGFERARHVVNVVMSTLTPPTARAIRMIHLPKSSNHVFSGLAFLVDAEYVACLDECVTYDPGHIDGLVRALGGGGTEEPKKAWAHSFRRVGDDVDNSECLGNVCVSKSGGHRIDLNAYLLRRDVAMHLAAQWTMPCPERAIARILMSSSLAGGVSRSASIRVPAQSLPPSTYDFIAKDNVYIFHLFPKATKNAVASNDFSACTEKNVLDGYENIETIPSGAVCVASVWRTDTLPLEMLKKRAGDVTRVAIMCEGPTPRTQRQWTKAFLRAHFDIVLACWMPLVECPPLGVRVEWWPYTIRHAPRILTTNRGCGRSVGTVAAPKSAAWTTYEIDGTCLETLDVVREMYAGGLRDLEVHDVETGETPATFLGRFVFALVIEECSAQGYVSEKFYDALIAGCIPLYYASGIVPQLGIPDDSYIDIRAFEDGHMLQSFLDGISDENVRAYRMRVDRTRDAVIRSVAFNTRAATVFSSL
jgi:hypothetical protein